MATGYLTQLRNSSLSFQPALRVPELEVFEDAAGRWLFVELDEERPGVFVLTLEDAERITRQPCPPQHALDQVIALRRQLLADGWTQVPL